MTCCFNDLRLKTVKEPALAWIRLCLAEFYQHVQVNFKASAMWCPTRLDVRTYLFIIDTTQLGQIIDKYKISRQHFADDT